MECVLSCNYINVELQIWCYLYTYMSFTFLKHCCDIVSCLWAYAKAPEMSSCMLKVKSTTKHEQTTNALIRGSKGTKCSVTTGVAGTRFATMHYNGLFKRPNISPYICPTLMLGEMLDRLNTMLGDPTLTFLMLGAV